MAYTVYCHTNKINGKKYVGVTSKKPEERWRNGNGYKGSPYFNNAIKKYGWEEFAHEILFTGLTLDEAETKERELIQKWGTLNPNGYNAELGGIHKSKHSDETRAKISASNKGTKPTDYCIEMAIRANTGSKWTEERRLEFAQTYKKENHPMYGKKQSAESKAKNSRSHKGLQSLGNHPLAKSILQYDLYGNLINKYSCCMEAKNKTGLDNSGIGKCCKGIIAKYGGYVWKYEE